MATCDAEIETSVFTVEVALTKMVSVMSLKYGIYLVEQRIVSPEQFCGLVKIQQEATMSLATIAIRKNALTIKQVSKVLDIQESSQGQSFIQVALDEELIDCADADRMLHEQQMSCPTIQKLVVECGLLTQRQSAVLFHHFEKLAAKKPVATTAPVAAPATTEPVEAPQADPQEAARSHPRQPKFTQRPVIVQPYTSHIQQ